MKKLLFACLFFPSLGWSAYQPITGSSVTVFTTVGGNLAVSGTVTSNQGTAGTSKWGIDLTTGVSVNSNGQPKLGVDLSTGVSVNTKGQPNLGVDLSTGVQVFSGPKFLSVDLSTGVQVFSAPKFLSVDLSTGVSVNSKGQPNLGVDLSTGVQVNTGGKFLGVDFSTGVQVVGSLSDNGAASATNRAGVLPSIYQNNYLNGTAATQGRNGALSQGTDGLLWTASLPAIRPASFSASTGTIIPATSATHIAAICGNPTNTVLVYGLRVSCTQTTAGNVGIGIVKTSSTFAGAYTTMTVTADDSNMNVAVSSAIWLQVNPTNPGLGTGNLFFLDNYKLGCMAAATASPDDMYISPADWRMKPIVLRGVSQCVAVNLLSTTVTGGSFAVTFDWMETTTISP